MLPLIDIENASGVIQGDGPIYTARGAEIVAELDLVGRIGFDVPTSDPRAALLVADNVARVYGLISGTRTLIGAGPLSHKGVRVSEHGVHVEGSDLLRELTRDLVDGLEISEIGWVTPDDAQTHEPSPPVTTHLTNALDGNPATGNTITLQLSPRRYLYVRNALSYTKLHFDLGATVNTNAATMNAQYFDGHGWQTLTISDGTAAAGKTLAQDGDITWTLPGDIAQVLHDGAMSYWLRFWPSANLTAVDLREITAWATMATLTGPQLIMALAPAGWSLDTGDWYDETATAAYYTFGENVTVLAALVQLAEMTGEHFRLGQGREIEWLQADQPDCGLRAVAGGSPLVEDNDTVCIILDLEEIEDAWEIVNRVYPTGGGLGPARVTLADCTQAAPAGYTLSTVNNYLEKTTVTTRISRKQSFPEVRSTDNGAAHDVQAANQLFRAALAWLQQRDTAQKFYRCTVTKLASLPRPGSTIRVVYMEVADDYVAVDIDADLVILSAAYRITDDGRLDAELQLGTIARRPDTDATLLVREMQRGQVPQRAFNQVSSAALDAALANSSLVQDALFRRGGAKPDIAGDHAYENWRASISAALEQLGLATDSSGTSVEDVSGSRGGNAALAALLTALVNLGLITDSTSA